MGVIKSVFKPIFRSNEKSEIRPKFRPKKAGFDQQYLSQTPALIEKTTGQLLQTVVHLHHFKDPIHTSTIPFLSCLQDHAS